MSTPEPRQLNPSKVRAAREAAGASKAAGAAAAGLSLPGYYRWENEVIGPLATFNTWKAERLAARYGVTLLDLTDPLPAPALALAGGSA